MSQFAVRAARVKSWLPLSLVLLVLAYGMATIPDESASRSAGGLVSSPALPPSEASARTPLAIAFDRAAAELLAGGDSWQARSDADAAAAAKHLKALVAALDKRFQYEAPANVLFIRSGDHEGRRWMAFACFDAGGAQVFGFERDDPARGTYERPIETRHFWSTFRKTPPTYKVVEVRRKDDDVRTIVDVDGARNVIDWWIRPADPSKPREYSNSPRMFRSAAAPRTGWTDHNQWWWPQEGSFTRLDGLNAERTLAVDEGPFTIAALDDGRIVAASPKSLELVDPKSGAKTTHLLPKPTEYERERHFFLSPRGRWCYAYQPGILLDTLSGQVQAKVEPVGGPRPCFPDEATLVLTDNTQIHKLDCATGRVEKLPLISRHRFRIAMAGGLTAFDDSRDRDVAVVDAQEKLVGKFEQCMGLHQIGISPDGKHLALKGQSGMRLFEIASGRKLWEHELDTDFHTARSRIKWSHDGRFGAAGGNQYVYVWSLTKPYFLARFPHGCSGYWPDVTFSADGKSLFASAAGTKAVSYWPDLNAAIKQAE